MNNETNEEIYRLSYKIKDSTAELHMLLRACETAEIEIYDSPRRDKVIKDMQESIESLDKLTKK